MQIDFSQTLKDMDGNAIPENLVQPEEGKYMTLGQAAIVALMSTFEDERPDGAEKVKRYDLALAIHAAKEPLDMPVEALAKIKELIGKGYGPLVVGQAWKMLDGN